MKPEELKYSKDHVWVAVEGVFGRIGITDHAQRELGDIVFIDLPEAGREIIQGMIVGSIESVKTTNELLSPISGEVIETNQAVRDKPEIVNSDPLDQGWLFRVRLSAVDELRSLMDVQAYAEFVQM